MIPRRYIEEWRQNAPWPDNAQVEQDLVIERALIEIFSDDILRENLAFRGGTALHKIFLKPQVRYSEDIDLVQIKEGSIKPLLERLRERMKFLGTKRSVKQNVNNNTIVYRFESEIPPVVNLRLKIEINCREHFSVLGLKEVKFETESTWFKGSCSLISYELEELLGTKLRALYQRRKGRDLFDLWWAANNQNVDRMKLLRCYNEYMGFVVPKPPTSKQFLQNLDKKITEFEFGQDIIGLLRPGVDYEQVTAYHWIKDDLIVDGFMKI
ncbi:nucleotidyl transferase AbiEii/AbiGii toxin family protein [Gaoshiqia sediminis]|uniref:Nucleotidyl transferase AbiEii/AbiGii toxin family protein n=1 Tax=Gaoshiqia sediminis TaxID=2986998 RepID=A0AA41Y8P4_9BACT|nr:nucleotidyl transferase AbiEii/AbiGii toxin family protein [Gaoshiqia sediminis]MCW0481358.1 nucleotidyl transferase AbiEii/AbiGii toxin family protein [Gaoshiqia sediminis]